MGGWEFAAFVEIGQSPRTARQEHVARGSIEFYLKSTSHITINSGLTRLHGAQHCQHGQAKYNLKPVLSVKDFKGTSCRMPPMRTSMYLACRGTLCSQRRRHP